MGSSKKKKEEEASSTMASDLVVSRTVVPRRLNKGSKVQRKEVEEYIKGIKCIIEW